MGKQEALSLRGERWRNEEISHAFVSDSFMAEQKLVLFDSLSTSKEVLHTFHFNIWIFLAFFFFLKLSLFMGANWYFLPSCIHLTQVSVLNFWPLLHRDFICSSRFGTEQESRAWCITVIQTFLVKWDSENRSYWFAFVFVLGEREVQTVVQLLALETYSLANVLAEGQLLE